MADEVINVHVMNCIEIPNHVTWNMSMDETRVRSYKELLRTQLRKKSSNNTRRGDIYGEKSIDIEHNASRKYLS